MSDEPENPDADLGGFAAAVAHELRTPLTAIACELELLLRRERSAAEYRDALRHIAASVSELVELSGDLTVLSQSFDAVSAASATACLDTVLARVGRRYEGRDDVRIAVGEVGGVQVGGNEERLGRAITLVIDHAVQHRNAKVPVQLSAVRTPFDRIRLVVDARPAGFWSHAWKSLTGNGAESFGLHIARRILEASGGALAIAGASEPDVVHIELRECI